MSAGDEYNWVLGHEQLAAGLGCLEECDGRS